MDIIKNKNVVIIGNGTSLIGRKFGKLIDKFDIVVRFNKYELNEKWYKDLGSKVDITVYGFGNIKRIKNIVKEDNSLKIISSSQKTEEEIKSIVKYNYNYIDKSLHNKIKQKINCPDPYRVSNGLIMIILLLENNCKVTIGNFDHSNEHYYKWKSNHTHHHNWEFERSYIHNLIKNNLINKL